MGGQDTFLPDLVALCESHSQNVKRVEKKIGFKSLIQALRDIIEAETIEHI